jgi:archaellum component FlaF (FlaF/FlaG flagellin family)
MTPRDCAFLLVTLWSSLSLAQSNPVPFISQPLVPASIAPGGSDFTLTINGTGFVRDSIVKWNGEARATHFVSRSRLDARISGSDVATAGTARITVSSPAPGGGTSGVAFFPIATSTVTVAFAPVMDFYAYSSPYGPAIGDFNEDGSPDIAVIEWIYGGQLATVLLNNGDGTFQPPASYSVVSPLSITAGDFNADGHVDLAIGESDGIRMLLGSGDGTFRVWTTTAVGVSPAHCVAADFNRDGKLDLACGLDNIGVAIGNGDGTFQFLGVYPAAAGPQDLVTGDFNGDGILDLASSDSGSASVSVLLGNGDGSFGAYSTFTVKSDAYGMAAADVDGDGKLDLLVCNGYDAPVMTVLLGNGDGTFRRGATYQVSGSIPGNLITGDFNQDGNLDAGVATITERVSILLGVGNGTFSSEATAYGAFKFVSAADFNGDGRLDLASTDFNTNVLIFPQTTALLSPPNVSFGNAAVGVVSKARAVMLTNMGSTALNLSGLTIGGVNSGDFAQTNDCGTSLGPGASCEIDVTFSPTNTGSRSAALSASDDAVGSPQSVPLSGTGVAAVVTLTPSSLTYPSQSVGTLSAPQAVTMTNTGSLKLSLSSISVSGDFVERNNCGAGLLPGGSCRISIAFRPRATGTRSGTVTITDNGLNAPQTIPLAGTGVP